MSENKIFIAAGSGLVNNKNCCFKISQLYFHNFFVNCSNLSKIMKIKTISKMIVTWVKLKIV